MAQQITFEQYMSLLREIVGEDYKNGTWHPEDIGTGVAFANETLWKVLSLL